MKAWNTDLPEPLKRLNELEYDYAGGRGIDFEPYGSFLSASETACWFKAWTGNQEVDGSEFRIFGQDGSGGYAAVWLTAPEASLLEQPIVFLGSEGERGVIACDFTGYLWLLAGGVGPCEAITNPNLARDPVQSFTRFAEAHSTTSAMKPADVLCRARNAYPSFSAWVDSQCR